MSTPSVSLASFLAFYPSLEPPSSSNMAPQALASSYASTSTIQSTTSPSASSSPDHKPFVPVALLIFLGLCLAYTISYLFYRFVTSRRLRLKDDAPDTPDRGVTHFMNGNRLTLNLGSFRSPIREPETPATPSDEAKHVTTPDHPEETTSLGLASPFIILTPTFTVQTSAEFERIQTRLQTPHQDQDTGQSQPLVPDPSPVQAQPPSFSQRVAAKVKLLSLDRVEAISLDPKLAPVQGPLRPLSMQPSPPRKKRMTKLFGLGFKHVQGTDPEQGSDTR